MTRAAAAVDHVGPEGAGELSITGVDGGAGGTRVVVDDLERLAGVCRQVARDVGEGELAMVLAGAGLAVDATAVLAPVTAARASAALGMALGGPSSPVLTGEGAQLLGGFLEAAAAGYDGVEAASTALWDLSGALSVVQDVGSVVQQPQEVLAGGAEAWAQASENEGRVLSPGEVAGQWASEHGEDLERRIAGVGVLASPLAAAQQALTGRALVGESAVVSPVALTAHALAPAWDRGRGVLGPVSRAEPTAPPRTLEDLVRGLDDTSRREDGVVAIRTITSGGHGGVDTAAGARRAVVVDIPGTDDWSMPGHETDDVRDLGGNISLVGGDPAACATGVADAVAAAGVPKDVPITLTGHSQGGMTAVVAADLLRARGYHVTHVISAAAPLATLRQPAGVTTLAIEGERDLIPRLDGRPNGDQAHRVTVRFDSGRPGVGVNHDVRTYAAAARAIDGAADTDPSVRAVRDSLRRDGVLVEDPSASAEVVRVRITAVRGEAGKGGVRHTQIAPDHMAGGDPLG